MTKPMKLVVIGIGMAIYAPFSMLIFGTTTDEMFTRVYFTLGGAAIALYCGNR